jgi:hypothetical protein
MGFFSDTESSARLYDRICASLSTALKPRLLNLSFCILRDLVEGIVVIKRQMDLMTDIEKCKAESGKQQ